MPKLQTIKLPTRILDEILAVPPDFLDKIARPTTAEAKRRLEVERLEAMRLIEAQKLLIEAQKPDLKSLTEAETPQVAPPAMERGESAPETADTTNSEVSRLFQAGKYAEAIPLAQRALALNEKALRPDHPNVGTSLNNLALLYGGQGRYAEAEPLFQRNLAIAEKALGPNHAEVGTSLNNLAQLYWRQGRYAEAEPIFRRSLAIWEKALGPHHPQFARSLNNLAALYDSQGRYVEAEPPYRRSLAIWEKALGPDHVEVGLSLSNLAALHESQGRYAEAEPLYKRGLAILEKALGPDHPNVGQSLNNLAFLYKLQGRYAEAEPLLLRSLVLREKALGTDHPDVSQSLNNLADLYRLQGRYAEAEPVSRRSVEVREKALGPDHPDVSQSLDNLALLALAQNDLARAAEHWRRSSAIVQRRAERGLGSQWSSRREAQRKSWVFAGLVKTTHRLAAEGSSTAKELAADMFETAQWGVGSEAAVSLAQMAARSSTGAPELAALVRERQDLVGEWQGKDKLLMSARSEPPDRRNDAGENALSDRLAAIDDRLAAIDARLNKDFPGYAALASPKPVSVPDVQASLRDDEALVLFLDTDDRFKPLPEETFMWVVTRSEVRWLRSELGTAALQREVAALRCGLDATAWAGEGALRCADFLKLPPGKVPKDGQPLPFDPARAHALYASLLGEARDLIEGKHLLVVPSGALTTLPFQVLVTEAPASSDLAKARWLVRDHAITVLPSAASLVALRRTGRPSAAAKPMLGFANPLLDGNQKDPKDGAWYKKEARRARARMGCAAKPKPRTAARRAIGRSATLVPQVAGLANLAHLRVQDPLPETADEVCEVARSIGADVSDMRIGARATETEIKRLSAAGDLAGYRILHFATHGLLAGQLTGTREPGLILTPPRKATQQDDGYLSGSEIAALKLDADWVILSACNTAGGTGKGEAAEALSGLARVFFYAGARALLVSHWEVDSDAAVKLVTKAVGALAKDEGLGRAEALRRAMLAAMADTSRPAHWTPAWHPEVWAPFVVVGEGAPAAGR